MHSIPSAIVAAGGFLRRRDLLGRGFSDHEIDTALSTKQIFRVRQGWYSIPAMSDVAVRAVRIGGRVTGFAALLEHGLWIPAHSTVDIAVPADARALRRPDDMRARLSGHSERGIAIHRIGSTADRYGSAWLASVDEALSFVLSHVDRELAIVCFDSALQRKKITDARIDQLFENAPNRVKAWRRDIDGRAQSGGETIARLRSRAAGIRFEPQAHIPGVGHLDGKIGRRTYLEIDGEAGHANATGIHEDRRRDLEATIRGNRVLRLDYPQLYFHWPKCIAAMRACLAWERRLGKSAWRF